jgi:hypothetical protein
LGDPDEDGRIMLRSIFRKWDVGVWTGLICIRIGTGDNEPSGSIKCGEYLDQLITC